MRSSPSSKNSLSKNHRALVNRRQETKVALEVIAEANNATAAKSHKTLVNKVSMLSKSRFKNAVIADLEIEKKEQKRML